MALATLATAPPDNPSKQKIFLSWDRRHRVCVPRINGVQTGNITTEQGKVALMAALPRDNRPLHVLPEEAGVDLPFFCGPPLNDALMRAHYRGMVNYAITELPPPPPMP